MLLYDPLKRPTAQECLDHHYFKGLPRPTRTEKLPKPELQPPPVESETPLEPMDRPGDRKRKMEESLELDLEEDDENGKSGLPRKLF